MSALARLVADHAAIAGALPAAPALRDRRSAALALVAKDGLPGPREENWRYANLRSLERVGFTPPLALQDEAIAQARALLPGPLEGFRRFVFVDGLFAAPLSAGPGEANGVANDA